MKLELHQHHVRGICIDAATTLRDGILSINGDELSRLILADARIADVSFDVAAPGEPCRIVQVWDVAEPRCRAAGQDFPGILGPVETVGHGVTHALRGMGIAITNPMADGAAVMIIDMFGAGAEWGLYGNLHNLVIQPQPAANVDPQAFMYSLRVALLRAGVFLAGAARHAKPDEVDIYELPPLTRRPPASGLPRVAYVYQVHSHQFPTGAEEPVLYGSNVRNFLPTVLHPNEVLDGAVVRGYYSKGYETYTAQNHPIIRELYARHGAALEFVGMIATVAQQTEPERLRGAAMAAKLVTEVLGADGTVLSKTGGGAPHIDMGQIAEYLERDGVRTTLLVQDMSGDGSPEGALLFNFPGADAIVNTGSTPGHISLPAAERIIGAAPGALVLGKPAGGPLEIEQRALCGADNPIGSNRIIAEQY